MKMKKIAAAVMMVSMVAVTAVGCGSSNGTDTKGADANQSDATSDWDETSDVTIVSREDGSGTRGAFIELFGIEEKQDDGTKVDMTTTDAQITNNTSVMLTTVADNEYAIGYVSLGSLDDTVKAAVADMKDGEIILLENTRYRAEETKNGDEFSKELASLCDVFVNDAFGTAHRAHCSNVGVTKYVDTAVVGYLMQKEIDFLGNAVNNPDRPFVAILGGAKVSSKISVIENLLDKVDTLIIGGGMAYTFAKAQGGTVGKSLLEEDYCQYALDMLKKAQEKGVKLLLPVDTVIADDFSNEANKKVVKSGEIPDGWQGLDIGPETEKIFCDAVKDAKTVVWNGPMGCFEMPKFAKGTETVAKALADTDAVTIIGGGDSAAAVNQLGYGDKMTHISTGGGASLEFLEGKELPGVAAANDK